MSRLQPAADLRGREFKAWKILRQLPRAPQQTGATFSIPYEVEDSNGKRAFLKALDIPVLGTVPGVTQEDLIQIQQEHIFERDIGRLCKSRQMSRVVTILDDGEVVVRTMIGDVSVPVLVFECADGDANAAILEMNRLDPVWALRTAHHVATGLMQLHGAHVAHQDVKPSNVVVFKDTTEAKLADLGSASARDMAGPRDHMQIPGARSYAPPELLYGWQEPDWTKRRVGCDVYLLGSLITSFFTGLGMTAHIFSHLDSSFRPDRWGGSFQDVLPYVEHAFVSALSQIRSDLPETVRDPLLKVVRELSNPDPTRRGPPGVQSNRLTLEIYVSHLDRLAKSVSISLAKSRRQ